MPTIDYETYCTCGEKLNVVSTENAKYELRITVEPCDKCLYKKYDEGYRDGQESAEVSE